MEIAKHLKEPNDTNVEDKCLSLFESWMTKSKLSLAYYMFANKDVFYSKEFMIKVSMTSLLWQSDIQPAKFKFLQKKWSHKTLFWFLSDLIYGDFSISWVKSNHNSIFSVDFLCQISYFFLRIRLEKYCNLIRSYTHRKVLISVVKLLTKRYLLNWSIIGKNMLSNIIKVWPLTSKFEIVCCLKLDVMFVSKVCFVGSIFLAKSTFCWLCSVNHFAVNLRSC